MPKIINAYSPDDSIGASLKGLADSFFTNTPQMELARQKAKGAMRENENIPLLADAIVANDVNAAARAGIMSGQDPKFTGGYGQYVNVNRFGPGSREATTATMAVPGANYGNTVQGVNAEMANKRGIAQMTTDRALAHDMRKYENTPTSALVDGVVRTVSQRDAIQRGLTPVLNQNQAQGVILQQDMPGLSPEQRANAGGYAPKNPGAIYSYQTPTGQTGTTIDGVSDAHTRQPLPQGTKAIKLEGPNADGLGSDTAAKARLNESRIASRTAVGMVDGLIGSLSQPNADQSVGYLGTLVNGFNSIRAQSEATVRLIGGESATQAFTSPDTKALVDSAMTTMFRDPNVVARAQQLGIDASIIRSQIQDLAYATAKAQDPTGRVGVDDIRRATETIAGTLQDPKVAIPTLQHLRQRFIEAQEIRESETARMYPSSNPAARPAGAPAQAAPAAAQPQAPGTAPQAPIRWGRDANGQPARLQ